MTQMVINMKCMSCETDIPSEWQAAITANNCPKCGDVIMDDATKNLFDELKSVMMKLDSAGDEIKSLLLSNYNLVVADKISNVANPEDHSSSLKIAKNPVQEWLARSNAPNLAKRENLKDLVRRIQETQSEPYEGDIEDISSEQLPDEQSAKTVLENNSLLTGKENTPPPTPEEKKQLITLLANSGLDGIDELPPALQEDRIRRLEQRRRVASGVGGDKGTFRRSD